MRFIFVEPSGVRDSFTGEISERPYLAQLLITRPGGIIAGRNLYPVIAPMVAESRGDAGWTTTVMRQGKRVKGGRVGGVLYFARMTYRFPKESFKGYRFRPGSVKWLVLNLELFTETDDIEGAARGLVEIAESRGVSPRHSPGAFGAAMLRASHHWKDRRPAPWFISELARSKLPGNYYALRDGYRRVPRAYYLDQKAAHHNVVAQVGVPHPHRIHARGLFRAAYRGETPKWLPGIENLTGHSGLIAAMVETNRLGPREMHLYPEWAREPGRRLVWLWSSELRLLDSRTKVCWVVAAFTARETDPALTEYAEWSLARLAEKPNGAVKPALLAAYGMLAVQSKTIQRYSIHGRLKPRASDLVSLPLLPTVYRSTVEPKTVSTMQNVVARGVIEAEVRTRSIEYARELESQGIPVVHIYADGLIAATDQLPFLPAGWGVQASLTDVSAPNPSSIESRELVRLPGIPGGRRTLKLRPSFAARHVFDGKPLIQSEA